LDREEFQHSPLKAFFNDNFSPEDKELVDNISFLAIKKTINNDLCESAKQKLTDAMHQHGQSF
jgi:hypothetical protein